MHKNIILQFVSPKRVSVAFFTHLHIFKIHNWAAFSCVNYSKKTRNITFDLCPAKSSRNLQLK